MAQPLEIGVRYEIKFVSGTNSQRVDGEREPAGDEGEAAEGRRRAERMHGEREHPERSAEENDARHQQRARRDEPRRRATAREDAHGEDTEAVREQVMGTVRAHFRPEFLNRVDEIILFHRLQKSEMGRIVEIQFGRLQKLVEERKIVLTLDAAARDWLAAKGWDPAYGARPLKRVIQRHV